MLFIDSSVSNQSILYNIVCLQIPQKHLFGCKHGLGVSSVIND
jgi:hypothetical protein